MVYTPNGMLFNLKTEGKSVMCTTGMKLEDVMWSRVSQPQKDKHCVIPPVWGDCRGQIQSQDVEWWLSGARRGRNGVLFGGANFQFCKMRKSWRSIAQQCEYIQLYWIVHFKTINMMNFVTCFSPQSKNTQKTLNKRYQQQIIRW